MARTSLSPRKLATQQRARQTFEAILEAAAQVLTERGYAGGTTNHIAERAGVSIGSLYQYFPNKDAILVALVERHLEETERLLRPLFERAAGAQNSLEALLRDFVETILAFHTREPALHRLLFEEAPHPKQVRKALQVVEEKMASRVAELLQAHPEARSEGLEAAAYVAIHAVEGLAHHFVLHAPRGMREADLVGEVVALLHGYLARPGIRLEGSALRRSGGSKPKDA